MMLSELDPCDGPKTAESDRLFGAHKPIDPPNVAAVAGLPAQYHIDRCAFAIVPSVGRSVAADHCFGRAQYSPVPSRTASPHTVKVGLMCASSERIFREAYSCVCIFQCSIVVRYG